MEQLPLIILFRDEHYVAVHKPPGLLVHRSWLSQDSVFLLQLLRDQIGRRVYPVHRLDRATSGVIVFGLSSEAAQRLCAVFENGQARKTYQAVVRGWLPQAEMHIDHALKDLETNTPHQSAQTRLRELARIELPVAVDKYPQTRYALVEAQPLTGRRHQIRKHLKHISHPIIGDVRYGKGPHNRFFREHFGIERLLLRASHLGFTHPYTGETLRIRAAPEPAWEDLMERLGWRIAAQA